MSKDSKPLNPSNDFIVLGTIVRSHGLKGEVKISLSCSGVDRLESCKELRLLKDGKELKKVSVIRAFTHSDGDAVVRFKEVQGVDEAETLRGVQVAVREEDREELPENEYYSDDLLGLTVVKTTGEDLGRIEEVMEGLANGVFVVRKNGKETLVPALKSVIREIDLKSRRMVVELLEEIDAETAD